MLEERARAMLAQWDEQWQKRLEIDARWQERETQRLDREAKKLEAEHRNRAAQTALKDLETILRHTLTVNDAVEWEALKRCDQFAEAQPLPPAPVPELKWFEHLIPGRRARHISQLKLTGRLLREHQRELNAWKERARDFELEKAAEHKAVDNLRARYHASAPEAVEEYCEIVLSRSIYPDYFPNEFEVEYIQPNKTLLIEYRLPAPDDLPTLKEVRYIKNRDEFKKTYLSEAHMAKLFDTVCYEICLRTVHEIFEADVVCAIDAVIFNGWLDYIDKSTGNETSACIMSLHVAQGEFQNINLRQVDPKACFRSLKGVASSHLHAMAPVAPILRMTRHDPRFVQAQEVGAALREGTNLATIGWNDFEHLIREVFEAQFKQVGGEVRVTQSSRDGGVDAVIFDPDPIRGGKIVVQAKRYVNPVGVHAVRDLYGTVMNEGATKGILVTTSNFGPDAYKFAKDKPISLIDGSNLLHLMANLGHRVRIDLREARQLMQG